MSRLFLARGTWHRVQIGHKWVTSVARSVLARILSNWSMPAGGEHLLLVDAAAVVAVAAGKRVS